jgi:hypothetical protein
MSVDGAVEGEADCFCLEIRLAIHLYSVWRYGGASEEGSKRFIQLSGVKQNHWQDVAKEVFWLIDRAVKDADALASIAKHMELKT